MTKCFLSSGRAISLGRKLASGGQGSVYEIHGDSRSIAKIFHSSADDRQFRKLVCMIKKRNAELDKVSAWPIDLLSYNDGKCIGFIMPRIHSGHEIDKLAHPAEQRIAFPEIDYGFLLHVAMNLARATAVVHGNDCIVGDFNERNILVLDNGTIRFIDTDSFQIIYGGEVFPCPVGSLLYTPPELRGQPVARVRRNSSHDAFGLAILIFQLLTFGRHPYAGVPQDGRARTIEDAIQEGAYAYDGGSRARLGPPPDAIDISTLGLIRDFFQRAFTTQSRPSAVEWMNLLDRERSRLRKCARNSRHAVFQGANTCTLCSIARDPLPTRGPRDVDLRVEVCSIAELIAEASRLGKIQSLTTYCIEPPLSTWDRHIPRISAGSNVKGCGIGFAIIGLLCAILLPSSGSARALTLVAGIVVGAVMSLIGVTIESAARSRMEPMRTSAERAIKNLDTIEQVADGEATKMSQILEPLWRNLQATRTALATAERQMTTALSSAERSWQCHQLNEFLKRFLIRQADITGIGPSRMATLASFGVETAADVTARGVRRVPGFGEIYTSRLVEWRNAHEREFKRLGGAGQVSKEWIGQIKNDHQQDIVKNAKSLRDQIDTYSELLKRYNSRVRELALRIDEGRKEARSALATVRP